MSEYLKSGRQAIRLLYFLLIGFSITKSLTILFNSDSNFSLPSWETIILFCVFLSFITRFLLGAYRILSEDIEIEIRRVKITIDAFGFFSQSLMFFVYSLSFYDLLFSQWMILIICAFDLVWLLLLARFFGIKGRTYKQWIFHNVIFILFCPINIFWMQSLIILLVISLLAFVIDLWFNRDFYFARAMVGLRIFVAGPYGDTESEQTKDTNVKNAREVGKELALKGHFPFIPHTMLHGWEMDDRFTVENFKSIDFAWLEFCDALFFIAPSTGANIEKNIAIQKGLQIFTSLDDVPNVSK